MDAAARKQLLLTRIAVERAQWTRDVGELRRLATPQQLLPGALRAAFGPGWIAGLFSGPRAGGIDRTGVAGKLGQALLMLRRHPVLWSTLVGAVPWLRRRRGLGRVLLWGALGAGVGAAAWAVSSQRRRNRPPHLP